MSQCAAIDTRGLAERVMHHLYRTLPTGHAGDLSPHQVRSTVEALVDSDRPDLLVTPVEDEQGLAAVLLLKERCSPLTREREGFLYCLVPCRPGPALGASIIEHLNRLMQRRGWTSLRISLFASDAPALGELTAGTNLNLGWIMTRKKLEPVNDDDDRLPGTTRPGRREDMTFVRAAWHDAYLAGLQEEAGWQSAEAALAAADAELASVLRSDHGTLVVIEASGRLIGFVAAEIGKPQELTGRPECYLYDCYVVPELRGQGYSQNGIRAVERLARERGCRYVTGTVTGPSGARIEAILSKIGPHGWTPYQAVYRCRAPLLHS